MLDGSKFCRSCGRPADAAPAREVAPAAEPGCLSCGAAVAVAARFCRSCGGVLEEQTWSGSNAPLDSDERLTSPIATLPEADRRCEICGGPADGTKATCASCSDLIGPECREPTAVMPGGGAPVALAHDDRGRGRFYALIAIVVIFFAAAGGAAAYFLVLAPEKNDERQADGAVAPKRALDSDPARSRGESGAASDDASESAARSESAAQREASSGAAPGDQADLGADYAGRSAGSDFEAAEGVLREHFTAINEGDYERAFSLFHPTHQSSEPGRDFLGDKEAEQPAVDLDSLEILPLEERRGDLLFVRLDVVAANTAGEDRVCRRFAGSARMQSVDGGWTYRPGTPGEEKPSLNLTPISPDDERCVRVTG